MWEYTTIKAVDLDTLIEKANKLGKQGWKAFGFATTQQGLEITGHHMMAFRRKLETSEERKKF